MRIKKEYNEVSQHFVRDAVFGRKLLLFTIKGHCPIL